MLNHKIFELHGFQKQPKHKVTRTEKGLRLSLAEKPPMNFKHVDTYTTYRASIDSNDFKTLKRAFGNMAIPTSKKSFIVDIETDQDACDIVKANFDTLYEVAVKDNHASMIEFEMNGH